VRLLFDENLSPRLVQLLSSEFPGSQHVRDLGLQAAVDQAVWEHAASHGFVIVSKDSDFRQRSFVYGPPPKVVWIQVGNCTTDDVAGRLRGARAQLSRFDEDPEAALLVLS
jgi:predicted nuclease of predicted toxin-antitoxin system